MRTHPTSPPPSRYFKISGPLSFRGGPWSEGGFDELRERFRGDLGQRDHRRLPDGALARQLRLDEAERVKFLEVLPGLRVAALLLPELLARDRVRLLRLARRDVRLLPRLARDREEDEPAGDVEPLQPVLDVRRM